jgi:predicted metal-dependent peptidase
MTFNLNMHVTRLLRDEPFFAELSRKMDKRSTTALPTAGVRVNPDSGYFEMLYNPEFFSGLTDEQRIGVLIHEFYHCVFQHVTERKPENVEPLEWNICADLAINDIIGKERLPDGCCIPGHGPFVEYPHGKTAEWYVAFRKKARDESGDDDGNEPAEAADGKPGEGDGEGEEGGKPTGKEGTGEGDGANFDDHGEWGGNGNLDPATAEIAKERLKEHLKDALKEGTKKGFGSISGEVRKEIIERLTTKINWKKVLRYFVKTSTRAHKSSTVKRINRRYAYIHPGKKVNRTAKIAVSIDQSGSVSDAMLTLFFNELNKLSDLAEFTVIPFDTKVAEDKVFVWKKGEKKKWERVLYGGTCFEAPTDYVNKGKFDGHLVLTDMCAPKPKASKVQRMWMTDACNAKNPYFKTHEKIIAVD